MPVTFTFGEMLSARSVIGSTLAELGKTHDNLWVLTPDIGATLVEFQETFPDRFLDVGLAEQVCVGIAAGLAYDGNIPVLPSTNANFGQPSCTVDNSSRRLQFGLRYSF